MTIPRTQAADATPTATSASATAVLDMDTITRAILENEGNMARVAELLLGSKFKQEEILSTLSADNASIDAFAAKTRAYALIKIIGIFSALHIHSMQSIVKLEPEESIKAFIKLGEVMAALSRPVNNTQTSNINIFEYIMKAVPPPIAEALREVIIVNERGELVASDNTQAPHNMLNGN